MRLIDHGSVAVTRAISDRIADNDVPDCWVPEMSSDVDPLSRVMLEPGVLLSEIGVPENARSVSFVGRDGVELLQHLIGPGEWRSLRVSSGSTSLELRITAEPTDLLGLEPPPEGSGDDEITIRRIAGPGESDGSGLAPDGSGDGPPMGFLGVMASPNGTVYIDGVATEWTTPARGIDVAPGEHAVHICYEGDRLSEQKDVLIRAGVNTNVFFRLRSDDPPVPCDDIEVAEPFADDGPSDTQPVGEDCVGLYLVEASAGRVVVGHSSEITLADALGCEPPRLVPNHDDGRTTGIRLVGIRPGSSAGILGFRNGDVVQSLDGRELSSPQVAMDVYEELQSSTPGTELEVRVLRRGEEVSWTIEFEE